MRDSINNNNPRPPGEFPSHALALVEYKKDMWYDPSYGKSFNSFEAWKKASIAGFYKETKVKDRDGSTRHAWLIRKLE